MGQITTRMEYISCRPRTEKQGSCLIGTLLNCMVPCLCALPAEAWHRSRYLGRVTCLPYPIEHEAYSIGAKPIEL